MVAMAEKIKHGVLPEDYAMALKLHNCCSYLIDRANRLYFRGHTDKAAFMIMEFERAARDLNLLFEKKEKVSNRFEININLEVSIYEK